MELHVDRCYWKISLLTPKGVWVVTIKEFQYDMTYDCDQYTKAEAKKQALKDALKYYNDYNTPKLEYLKWQLSIQ